MSSQIEELMPITVGKGSHMRIFIDHSKSVQDVGRNWCETTYDGMEGSDIVAVPGHWHKHHDEILEVTEGQMKFFVNGKEIIVRAGDEPLIVPRGTVHSFTVIKGVRVTFVEKNAPPGEYKALFFQDMFQASSPGLLMALRVFYEGDTYIALPGNIKILDQAFMKVFGFIAKGFVPPKLKSLKKLDEVPNDRSNTVGGGVFRR
ncbi:hypothetical protein F5884DRAFT_315683 [Xylogone sp. PMI_703]|nr:hypothetical protein F5884DRAFT_315683 [Xylogone sp. PMI_703]